MFRSDKPIDYEEVYSGLVGKLPLADFNHARLELGASEVSGLTALDVLGRTCLVGPQGVFSQDGTPLDFTVRICLAYYILHSGRGALSGNWVSYRDFKDGAFFHTAFSRTVEKKIADTFCGKIDSLKNASRHLSGRDLNTDLDGDFGCLLPVLPRVPLALVFYDRDEDFSSTASVLYDSSAPDFLDMECLAVLGQIVADQLVTAAGKPILEVGLSG